MTNSPIDTAEVVLPMSSSSTSSNYSQVYSLITKHVSYSCGSCGYELNLNSCNRDLSEQYEKSIKRGVISFYSIDESRFTEMNNKMMRWRLWFLFQGRSRTKLLCRNCGSYVGTVCNINNNNNSSSFSSVIKNTSAVTWDGISARRTYEIKIRSLRPLDHLC
ncbi:hypothetical protein ABFX02_08G114600 [Erythranthe guttata]